MTAAAGQPSDPMVTLVVAMRNESATIRDCLESLVGQTYPADRLELLVYDGASDDDSAAIAREVLDGRPHAAVGDNPRRTQASSWNLGITAATGEILGIVSGHAILDADYVTAGIECLSRTGADMVGGPVRAIGSGVIGTAIAVAMSTPFGVGGARFRYLKREAVVDTVFMGIARTETYRRFRFDERMVRNQDDELSYRLLDAGGTIVCSPAISSAYVARGTLSSLWTQYHAYGYWKVRVAELHPSQIRPRHLAPAGMLASFAGLGLASLAWRPAGLVLGALAAIYVAAMGVQIARLRHQESLSVLAVLPAVFVVLHVSYGVGFIRGLLERPRPALDIARAITRRILRHP